MCLTRAAISQSNYLPWKGYFDLIAGVDLFVFLDDVQYTKRDWRNRNRIVTPQGLSWISIPNGAGHNVNINDVVPSDHLWQKNHWERIRHSYHKAKYFKMYEPFFREFYMENSWNNLSELNQYLIKYISRDILGLKTEFLDSTQLKIQSRKEQRIIDILKNIGAGIYYSGVKANKYLTKEMLECENIELIWMNYQGYPEYTQFHNPFIHEVSIIDLLFHTGPNAWNYMKNVKKNPIQNGNSLKLKRVELQ